MKTVRKTGVKEKSNLLRVVFGTALILLIPMAAMRQGAEVNWTAFDFIFMGALLFTAGFMLDLAIRRAGKYRKAAILAIAGLFLYVWAELAVGVFTNLGS